MKKILIANWKMAPDSLKEATSLFERIRTYADSPTQIFGKNLGGQTRTNAEIVIAPPFIYLLKFAGLLKKTKIEKGVPASVKSQSGFNLAAQDVFWENQGAYTGEISPAMLKNLGVKYVIIGHSERRQNLGETDEMVNKKVVAALKVGLKVVLCVGEPTRVVTRELRIKNAELRKAKIYIKKQIEKDLKNSKFLILNSKLRNQLLIAYEPIWAISTSRNSRPATPEDALEMIKYIKGLLSTNYGLRQARVIYGGSVNSKNIASFLKYSEIDGALIGGASLKAGEFKGIIEGFKMV